MPWYAIRSVYHFGVKDDGSNIFEERVVSLHADSWADAHAKGEVESENYSRENGFDCHPEQEGYEQDGEPQIDQYEIWSQLFESRLSLVDFFAERYTRYDYSPEPTE
jgi:hypothetical protein